MKHMTLAEEIGAAREDRETRHKEGGRGAQMAFAMVGAAVRNGKSWIAKRIARNVSRMR